MTNQRIEMTAEKFAEIYTNEKFRNDVAFAVKCCDQYGHFLHFRSSSYPIEYIITEEQIATAKKELERAKAEIYANHSNDLLFCCMGGDYKPRYGDDVCNYRIRTEFTNRHGHRFFIECTDCTNVRIGIINQLFITYAIDRDKEIECNSDHHSQHLYNHYKGLTNRDHNLKYTKANILKLVNKQFDCCFKSIIIDQHTIHPTDREVICHSPKE